MGFFGLFFWLLVAWVAFRLMRRWGYCASGPRGYGRMGSGWYDSGEFYTQKNPRRAPGRPERSGSQEYIDALETRVSELEERLDFTERLLAGREKESGSV